MVRRAGLSGEPKNETAAGVSRGGFVCFGDISNACESGGFH